VPVIPTAMIGGFEFQPPGKIAPRLAVRPGVRFGKPLDFSRYYGLEEDRLVLRAMTDEIMYELMKLSGQEYVDEYAQRAKGRLAERLRHDGHGRSKAADRDLGEPGEGQQTEGDRAEGDKGQQATEPERVGAAEAGDD
jgi:1-acyl-sn-glycerol-3-phosphate acyltransferase